MCGLPRSDPVEGEQGKAVQRMPQSTEQGPVRPVVAALVVAVDSALAPADIISGAFAAAAAAAAAAAEIKEPLET